ncbi:MAG: hypothetical protein EOO52_18225 [Gammaproteobacteria bacterium]|nr:MAG: hypothetical protein EOO52_18225 [Gammaproteobacteria bacterium]
MNLSIRKSLGLASLLGLSIAAASQAQAASCTYTVNNEWSNGFQGTVTITNNTSSAINGWTVGWQYNSNRVTSSWNATLSGSNPYSASNVDWNRTIQPGQSVSFGVQGNKNNNSSAEKPTITGNVCSNATSSAASSFVDNSSTSSAPRSSSSSSQTCNNGGSQCNWYGTNYPICSQTTSGWGYENGKSCITQSTCTTQPAPYGVVGGGASCPVSSARSSSVSSSLRSSSVSSVVSSSLRSSSVSSVVSSSLRSSSVSSVVSSSLRSSSLSSAVSSSLRSSSVASSVRSSSSSTNTSAGPR